MTITHTEELLVPVTTGTGEPEWQVFILLPVPKQSHDSPIIRAIASYIALHSPPMQHARGMSLHSDDIPGIRDTIMQLLAALGVKILSESGCNIPSTNTSRLIRTIQEVLPEGGYIIVVCSGTFAQRLMSPEITLGAPLYLCDHGPHTGQVVRLTLQGKASQFTYAGTSPSLQ